MRLPLGKHSISRIVLAGTWLIAASSAAYADLSPKRCLDLYHQISANHRTEEEALDAFNPRKFEPNNIKSLSDQAFLVSMATGEKYVVRIPNSVNDLARERFASEFVNRVPSQETPKTQILPSSKSQAVLSKIRAAYPKEIEDASKEWARAGVKPEDAKVSIAVFYPGKRGLDVIKDLSPDATVRTLIADSSKKGIFATSPMVRERVQELERLWPSLPAEKREALERDLKKLIPFAQDKSGASYIHEVLSQNQRLQGLPLQELPLLGILRLPPALRNQLADYWLSYTVLGIPDFHGGNWLMLDNKVIGIDLASSRDPALKGKSPLDLPGHQHPYGAADFTPQVRSILMQSVSPELKRYFRSLTRMDLIRMAAKADYKISEEELKEIEARIRAIQM